MAHLTPHAAAHLATSPLIPRVIAALGALLLAGGILLTAPRARQVPQAASHLPVFPTACYGLEANALDPNAYLPQALLPSDLSGYTLMIDIPGSDPRRKPCGLVAKRTQAFVRNDAVSGPGRAEVDGYTRQLGYPITAQPLFPIQGPFVLDHQGVFDIQSQTTAFLNTTDAQNEADSLWAAAQGPKWTTLSLGEAGVRASEIFGGDHPYEHWYGTAIWRAGTEVVAIDAFGTRGIDDMLRRLIPIVRTNVSEGLLHGSPPVPYSY